MHPPVPYDAARPGSVSRADDQTVDVYRTIRNTPEFPVDPEQLVLRLGAKY